MTWETVVAALVVEYGVEVTASLAACGFGISLGGVKWITWVVNLDEIQDLVM